MGVVERLHDDDMDRPGDVPLEEDAHNAACSGRGLYAVPWVYLGLLEGLIDPPRPNAQHAAGVRWRKVATQDEQSLRFDALHQQGARGGQAVALW